MREILFRGKRTDNGEWVYGDLIRDCICNTTVQHIGYYLYGEVADIENDDVVSVIPETVGQYTGLNVNGNKIYEGDIIKSEQDGMIGVIRFGEYQTTNSGNGECHLGFSIEWYGKYSDIIRRDLGWWVKAANKDINIVGNIHDNPELLEVK